jgi:hypothetical protein
MKLVCGISSCKVLLYVAEHENNRLYLLNMLITVAVKSEAWVLAGWLLGSWV